MKKRSIRFAASLCALSCAAFFAATLGSLVHPPFTSTANAAETPTPLLTDTALLQHGANLAAIGDCVVCHTANRSAPFAGGRPLDTPFGTIYSTNITPDRQTGIGDWTLSDFTRSIRRGIARDGHFVSVPIARILVVKVILTRRSQPFAVCDSGTGNIKDCRRLP
jgi:hypothetical protein